MEEGKKKKQLLEEIKEREAKEKRENILKMGRDGKGDKFDEYKIFCKSCHTEYLTDDITKCNRCGSTKHLMT